MAQTACLPSGIDQRPHVEFGHHVWSATACQLAAIQSELWRLLMPLSLTADCAGGLLSAAGEAAVKAGPARSARMRSSSAARHELPGTDLPRVISGVLVYVGPIVRWTATASARSGCAAGSVTSVACTALPHRGVRSGSAGYRVRSSIRRSASTSEATASTTYFTDFSSSVGHSGPQDDLDDRLTWVRFPPPTP